LAVNPLQTNVYPYPSYKEEQPKPALTGQNEETLRNAILLKDFFLPIGF
jgi:hypothetical protein